MSGESVRKIDDGGCAFPIPCGTGYNESGTVVGNRAYSGMCLRDYFAAKAMQAIISTSRSDGDFADADLLDGEDINPGGVPVNDEGDRSRVDISVRWVPATAYRFADAMIAARKTGGGA